MSSFILIHGSWHGAWCWFKVVPRLKALGHNVVAIDLPGHGRDRTAPQDIGLDTYVERVARAVDAAAEPVVLVAHSRAGIVASQVAEAAPDRIELVVYLAAYLLSAGERVVDVAVGDAESLVMRHLDVDPDGHWDMLARDAFVPALYADCVAEDVELAASLLTPEPSRPSWTPLELTGDGFGRVRRAYVELLDDRAVGLALQRRMQAALPCDPVVSIQAGHSAYFSRPDELVAHLSGIVESRNPDAR